MYTHDLILILYTTLYVVLAVRALLDWRRGIGSPAASLWFAQIFLSLAPASILSVLGVFTDFEPSPYLLGAALLPVVYYPYALFRFIATLRPVTITAMRLATWSTVVLIAWLIVLMPQLRATNDRTPLVQIYVAVESIQWLALTIAAISLALIATRGQPRVVRARMQSLAVGAGLLSAANILRAVPYESFAIVWTSATLAGAIAFYIGYATPAFIREIWNRADRARLRVAIVSILGARSVNEIGEQLLPATSAIVGGSGAALVNANGAVIAVHDFDTERAALLADNLHTTGSAPSTGQYRVLDDVAACRFGDDILLVTVDLATPMFGRDELELLGTVVSTSVLALERLTALEELQTREAQLVQSHRIAAVGSWEWHPVSREFNVTEELLPIFGLPASVDNVSLPALLDTIPTRDRDALERVARRAIQVQGEFAIDHELRLPDGSTRVVHTRGQVDTDSTFPRLIGTVQDVTDRKAIENALREAYDREREATERLTSLDRMKDGILVAVSHELRTPLTSILGFVMTLRDRGDSLDQATRDEMVEHMVDQAEKLDRLLTDLLNLNRLRSGTVDSNPSHVNVAELVRSCVEELGIPDEQLTLELEEGDNVVDTIKVERIIENLLTNARKYGPREGQITVQLRRQAGVVELIVSDEGPGIAPAERARVFDPFHRAPGTENIPGTGIGLSLVAEYAELHSGSAWVAANASGGAEFHVQLHDLEPRS